MDCMAQQSSSSPQPLLGPCREARIEDAARFCRIGYVANAVRKSVNSLRLVGQFAEDWGTADAWARELHDWDVDAAACARAAQQARRQSQLDWRAECLLSGLSATPCISEDWPDSAWTSPLKHYRRGPCTWPPCRRRPFQRWRPVWPNMHLQLPSHRVWEYGALLGVNLGISSPCGTAPPKPLWLRGRWHS